MMKSAKLGCCQEKGFSLIELMVAVAISMVLLIGLLAVCANILKSSIDDLRRQKLGYEMQSVMDTLTRDIQRAGYWGNAINQVGTNSNNNPFMAASTDISLPNSSCILFTYDKDDNGSLAALNTAVDDERYGFRLSNQTIQARTSSASFGCTGNAGWVDITNLRTLIINNLTFNLSDQAIDIDNSGTGTADMHNRSVSVTLTASLAQDPNVSATTDASPSISTKQA